MKKIWVKRPRSFKEAEKFDMDYSLYLSHTEKTRTMQVLREICRKINGNGRHENRKRLRRVIKIIQ